MNILTILKEIEDYYYCNRQLGHTTAMLNGMLDTEEEGLVVINKATMRGILRGTGVAVVTLKQIENGILRGRKQKIGFDNDAIHEICKLAAAEIEHLEKRSEQPAKVLSSGRNFWEDDGPIGNTD